LNHVFILNSSYIYIPNKIIYVIGLHVLRAKRVSASSIE
jgi:hypothetical protein